MLTLVFSELGVLVATAGSMTMNVPLVAIGAVLTMMALVWHHVQSRPFVKSFAMADWRPDQDGYSLRIPARAHRRGRAVTSTVYLSNNDGSEEVVFCDQTLDEQRGLTLRVSSPITGKVVVA